MRAHRFVDGVSLGVVTAPERYELARRPTLALYCSIQRQISHFMVYRTIIHMYKWSSGAERPTSRPVARVVSPRSLEAQPPRFS